jgi:hypothetical protein
MRGRGGMLAFDIAFNLRRLAVRLRLQLHPFLKATVID